MVSTRCIVWMIMWHSLFFIIDAEPLPKDCAEVLPWFNGAYVIRPVGYQAFGVLCQFDTDGTIWTFLQRNNGTGTFNWSRDWAQYRNGFGWMDFNRSFWLGLEKMYWLTASTKRHYVLRVDIIDDDGNELYADYDNFSISDEANLYYLSYGDFLNGSAGDGLQGYHRNKAFSTMDRDNDGDLERGCAELESGGWWYDECGLSALNRRNLYWNQTSGGYRAAALRVRAR